MVFKDFWVGKSELCREEEPAQEMGTSTRNADKAQEIVICPGNGHLSWKGALFRNKFADSRMNRVDRQTGSKSPKVILLRNYLVFPSNIVYSSV
jgi:hypothetical protein